MGGRGGGSRRDGQGKGHKARQNPSGLSAGSSGCPVPTLRTFSVGRFGTVPPTAAKRLEQGRRVGKAGGSRLHDLNCARAPMRRRRATTLRTRLKFMRPMIARGGRVEGRQDVSTSAIEKRISTMLATSDASAADIARLVGEAEGAGWAYSFNDNPRFLDRETDYGPLVPR
jgi:hypothetical protein